MTRNFLIFCLSALAAFAAAAQGSAGTAELYGALGGQPGIARLMDGFVDHAVADPRLAATFKDAKAAHLKAQLTDQICQLSGGPCRYSGPDMKVAHAELGIARADFNALVEVLQESMSDQGLSFGTQNRLLALLAPMYRDIVTQP
jgi:hemoglobin